MIGVFIVEDDPMVLEVNKSFLDQLSLFTYVGHAATGEDALKYLVSNEVDLILLDIYLPDMSGVDLLYEIRKANIQTDVIAITAARDAKTVRQLFRLGTNDYLVKPFRFERFKTALENYAKMWNKLQDRKALSQADIDAWGEQHKSSLEKTLPKGLSDNTLEQVFLALSNQESAITSTDLAKHLGLARVTARRYLEYLKDEGKVKVEMEYGTIGRPTHYYYI